MGFSLQLVDREHFAVIATKFGDANLGIQGIFFVDICGGDIYFRY